MVTKLMLNVLNWEHIMVINCCKMSEKWYTKFGIFCDRFVFNWMLIRGYFFFFVLYIYFLLEDLEEIKNKYISPKYFLKGSMEFLFFFFVLYIFFVGSPWGIKIKIYIPTKINSWRIDWWNKFFLFCVIYILKIIFLEGRIKNKYTYQPK